MTDNKRRMARLAGGAALVAAGIAGGGVLATSLSANAADTSSSSSSTTAPGTSSGTGSGTSSGTGSGTSSGTGSTTTTPPSMPAHGTAEHEDAEKAVTGANATKAKAAAVKSVGSGTAGDVTTDFTGSGYEVTVTKADGSTVEVHLDSSFTVQQGPGGHGGRPGSNGADGGAAPGQAPPAA